jgi:glycosyltransferase involved in cell wall biosynthesis
MKVAMLTSDYLPSIGGIASHIYELSNAMIQKGHEVEIWLWNKKRIDLASEEMGDVPIRLLDISGSQSKQKGLGVSFRLAASVRRNLQLFSPDILHVHTLNPLMLSMRWAKSRFDGRIVWTNHSSRYLRRIHSPFWRLKMKIYSSSFDGLLAPSQELLEKSSVLNIKSFRSRYIPNGVDISKFKCTDKLEARRLLGLPEDRLILLSTRRFSPKNGIPYLVRALGKIRKEIPEVLCVFCGNLSTAKDWPAVENIIREKNLANSVRMEGSVPNTKINDYLNAADVVILPSLIEATSISGLEAMATERPLVGTDVGGIPELIDDGKTGILVKPADVDSLAEGVLKLIKSNELDVMGANARKKVLAEFTWQRIAEKVLLYYKELF